MEASQTGVQRHVLSWHPRFHRYTNPNKARCQPLLFGNLTTCRCWTHSAHSYTPLLHHTLSFWEKKNPQMVVIVLIPRNAHCNCSREIAVEWECKGTRTDCTWRWLESLVACPTPCSDPPPNPPQTPLPLPMVNTLNKSTCRLSGHVQCRRMSTRVKQVLYPDQLSLALVFWRAHGHLSRGTRGHFDEQVMWEINVSVAAESGEFGFFWDISFDTSTLCLHLNRTRTSCQFRQKATVFWCDNLCRGTCGCGRSKLCQENRA